MAPEPAGADEPMEAAEEGGQPPAASAPPPAVVPQEEPSAPPEAPGRPARKGGPDYTKPSWAGKSSLQGDVAVELILRGNVRKRVELDLQAHDAFLFGRAPNCDVVLEGLEPKASRFHCVLQCKEGSPDLFLYDLGSSHGTMLNGRQVDPQVFEPLHVGAQLRFCADHPPAVAARACVGVLCGPEEAMEEEGEVDLAEFREKAAQERAELEKAMEADLQKRKDAKRQRLAKEAHKMAMAKALAIQAKKHMQAQQEIDTRDRERRQEVTWGMGEDAVEEQPQDGLSEEVQNLMDAAGNLDFEKVRKLNLTEKQEQLVQKAEQKWKRFANLQREKKRLEERAVASATRAALADKDFDDAPGAAARSLNSNTSEQLQRLDAKIEKVEDELSEFTDNILLSLGMKKSDKPGRSRRLAALYDTSLDDGDDDDFFDRTAQKPEASKCTDAQAEDVPTELVGLPRLDGVETCQTLEAKLSQLKAERGRLAAQQALERSKEKREAEQGGDEEDSLDAFMSGTVAELRKDRRAKLQRRVDAVERLTREVEAMLRIARRNADPAPAAPAAAPPPAAAAPTAGSRRGPAGGAAAGGGPEAGNAEGAAKSAPSAAAAPPGGAAQPAAGGPAAPAATPASASTAAPPAADGAKADAPAREEATGDDVGRGPRGAKRPEEADAAAGGATAASSDAGSGAGGAAASDASRTAANPSAPKRAMRGPERPSAALLAQAAALPAATDAEPEVEAPEPPLAARSLDLNRAGLQIIAGGARKRAAEDVAAMPPPVATPKEKRPRGPAPGP